MIHITYLRDNQKYGYYQNSALSPFMLMSADLWHKVCSQAILLEFLSFLTLSVEDAFWFQFFHISGLLLALYCPFNNFL